MTYFVFIDRNDADVQVVGLTNNQIDFLTWLRNMGYISDDVAVEPLTTDGAIIFPDR